MGELQIAEDLELQRAFWRFERVAWVVLAALLVAALLGLFGPGLLGPATTADAAGTIRAEYPRFARMQGPVHVDLELRPPGADDLRLWIDSAYLRDAARLRLSPEPDGVEVAAARVTYRYARADASAPIRVKLEFEPQRPGVMAGGFGLAGGGAVTLRHFVHP